MNHHDQPYAELKFPIHPNPMYLHITVYRRPSANGREKINTPLKIAMSRTCAPSTYQKRPTKVNMSCYKQNKISWRSMFDHTCFGDFTLLYSIYMVN